MSRPRGRNAMRIVGGGAFGLLCFWATLKLADNKPPPDTPHPLVPKSAPVTAATALEELPALPSPFRFPEGWDGNYQARWDGIDGLNASASSETPIVRNYPALELVVAPVDGLHRLGLQIRSLTPGIDYQIGFWTKAAAGTKVGLDVRDITKTNDGKTIDAKTIEAKANDSKTNFGSASFDLSGQTVLSRAGQLRGAGVGVGRDQWYKAWLQFESANGGLVAYLALLNSDGGLAYMGDGRTTIRFGGIEVKPVL